MVSESSGIVTVSDPDGDTASDLTVSVVSGKLRLASRNTATIGAGMGTVALDSFTVEVTTVASSLTAANFSLGNLTDQLAVVNVVIVPMRASLTADLEKVVVESGATLTVNGDLKAAIEAQLGSLVTTSGSADIGDGTFAGFVSLGSLQVNNPHTLTLRDSTGIVFPADTNIFAGGILFVRDNSGVHQTSTIPAGSVLRGTGAANVSTLLNGGTITGNLFFNSTVTVTSGILAPGTSTDPQRVWVNNANLNGGTLEIGIAGPAGIAVSGGNDALRIDNSVVDGQQGHVALSGIDLSVVAIGTPTIQSGDRYVIINNLGNDAVGGTLGRFASYAEGAVYSTNFLGSGKTARITYIGGDGNDVAIVVDAPTQVTLQGGNLTISDSLTHSSNNLKLSLITENSIEYLMVETMDGTAISGTGAGVRNVGASPSSTNSVLIPKASITGKITLQLQNGTSSDFDQLTLSNGVNFPITAASGEVDWIGVDSGATLRVDETLPTSSSLVIRSGGQLKGTGTVGSTTVYGTIAPGNSPGVLNTGSLNLFADSILQAEIGGTTPGSTSSSHDQIVVTGTVAISTGALFTPSAFNGFSPSVGNSFVLISNDGTDSITGNFRDLPEGTLLTNFLGSGLSFVVTYVGGDGNDFAIYSPLTLSYLDTGTSSSDGVTTEGRITVAGLTGQPWQYTVNGGANWTTGSGNSFVLVPGSYSAGSIRVRQTNLGNITAFGQINSRVFVDRIAQDITEIFASGKQQGELQGIAVAVSSKYRVVGSPQTDIQYVGDVGSVLVYDSNNVLRYTLANPSAHHADGFGTAVAISGDYIIVGSSSDSTSGNNDVGSVYVYDMRSGSPTVPIISISNPTPANSDGFGYAIAADGNYLVVGAPRDDAGATDSGTAYVYDLSSATPSLPFLTLTNPSVAASDAFGFSVAISGNRIAVGAYLDNTSVADAGNVMIYDLTSATPNTPVYTLTGASPIFNDQFGYSLAMSGNYVVVGVVGRDTGATDAGVAYVYDLSSGTPTVPSLTINNPTPAGGDLFGISIAMSGTKLVIGAHQDDVGASNAGSAYVYDLASGTPANPILTLNNPAANVEDLFGFAVSIAGDLVAVGAYGDDTVTNNAGSTYLYNLNSGTSNVPIASLSNPSNGLEDRFGVAVAAAGNFVAVGSTLDDTGGFNSGSVFVYDRSSLTPNTPVYTLTNPTPVNDDSFGYSVSMSGSFIAVGAPLDGVGASNAGSVYVYNLLSATPLVPVLTINNPSPASNDNFGWAVAISGTNLIIGAPLDDASATDSGSAYIYSLVSATPTVPIATLTNPSPASQDVFGRSVAISDRYAVVGAIGDDAGFADSGMAYVYDLTSGTISVPMLSLTNPSPASDDQYGFSVAVLGNTVAVTSLHDGTGGHQAGTIYLYDMSASNPGTVTTVINNPNPGFGESFGWSLAMSDDLLVVGARQLHNAESSSAAHVYDLSSTTKNVPIASLRNPNPSVIGLGDLFANSVAIAGNTVVAGAAFEDIGGVEQGAVYMFNIAGSNSVTLDGSGNLAIVDGYATGKANTISVSGNGSNIVLTDTVNRFDVAPAGGVLSNGRRTLTIPISSVPGRLVISSASGDDTVTIDFTNGNPIPAGGIEFNGGTAGNDTLRVMNGSTSSVVHNFTNGSDGSVVLGGSLSGTITYTGLEPIIDNLTVADRVFTYSGNDDVISVSTGSTLHNIIDSNFAESVEFNNPTNSLTINAGSGNDIVTITSIHSAFGANLTINGGTGNDTINLNSDINFAANNSLDVDLQNDDSTPGLDAVSIGANANLILAGSGAATIKVSKNIALASGSSIVTVNGNLTLEANQQTTASSGNFIGVFATNALASVTGSGSATIKGRGGDDSGGNQHGILIQNGADLIGGTTSTGILVEGVGGGNTGNSNIGLYVLGVGSSISSNGGSVGVSGSGGGSNNLSSSRNDGVSVSEGSITSGLNASLSVTGLGGLGLRDYGVVVSEATGRIASGGGQTNVSGTGGGGSLGQEKYGVLVSRSGTISAENNGHVVVVGQGGSTQGSSSVGVVVYESGLITSTNGNVSVTGTAGGAGTFLTGVWLQNSGKISAGGIGSVNVTGTGAAGTNLSAGVYLGNVNPLATSISSAGGNVTVTGVGGGNATSGSNYGVTVNSNSFISAGGTGTVTVVGTGSSTSGGANHGVFVIGTSANITSSGGAVAITGRTNAASSSGIVVSSSGVINDGGSGALSIVTNNLSIDATSAITGAVAGTITLKQETNGLAIDLGGSDVLNTTLGLTDAELDRISAGTLNIGDSNSGPVSISQPITHSNHLSIATGSTFTANNSITLSSNKNLTVNALSTIQLANSSADFQSSGTGQISLTSSRNVELLNGSSIITVDGNLTLEANQQSSASSGNFKGVDVNGGLVRVTGAGSLLVRGKGGTDSSGFQMGVSLGGAVQSTGSGSLTVEGTGGVSNGDRNYGVYLTGVGAGITSTSGLVNVTGSGGAGVGSHNYGILSEAQATISSGLSGAVTMAGFGGGLAGAGVSNRGIVLTHGAQVYSQNGNLQVSGTGGGGNDGNSGIVISSGSDLYSSGSGNVSVVGSGGTTGNSAGSYGIHVVEAGSTISSFSGNLQLTGTGGGAGFGSGNYGVYVENDADVSVAGSGSLNITGQGGNRLSTGTGSWNYGVYVVNSGSTVSSTNGTITINGTGGGGNTTSNNYGVFLTTQGQIFAGGVGQLVIVGQGGNSGGATGSANHGFSLDNGATVATNSGNLTLDGTGGAGSSNNAGVMILSGSLSAGGSGVLDIEGVGGSGTNSFGIRNYGVISSNSSTITLTGAAQGSGSFGIALSTTGVINGSISSSNGANITLVANSISLEANTSITTSSDVSIRTLNPSLPIDLGGNDVLNSSLGLSDADLDRISANNLYIGTSSGGPISVSQAISHANNLVIATGSSVSISDAVSLSSNKNLTIGAMDAVSFVDPNADISLLGSGGVNISTSRNISLSNGSSIVTVDGAITLSANQQSLATSGNFNGITVQGAVINSSTGSILLQGRGGKDSTSQHIGVLIRSNSSPANPSVVGQGTTGSVTIVGDAGESSNREGFGVAVLGAGTLVTSGGGNVQVTGTSGGNYFATTPHMGIGVYVGSGGGITSSGAGAVSVTGNTSSTANNDQWGVLVESSGSRISSSAGNVSVTGTGGSSSTGYSLNNYGVIVSSGGQISSLGSSSTVTVTGTGGSGAGTHNHGVYLLNNSSAISTSGGDLFVTGIGGAGASSQGIQNDSSTGGFITLSSGTLNLTADSMAINGPVSAGSGLGRAYLLAQTANRPVDLGNSSTSSSLSLSDAELDQISAGVLNIGRTANGGQIAITGGISASSYSTLVLSGSSGIDDGTSGQLSVTNLKLVTSDNIQLDNAHDVTTLSAIIQVSNKSFTFSDANSLQIGSVDTLGGIAVAGGTVLLSADTLDVQNEIKAIGGTVQIQPFSAGRVISLGSETSGELSLSDAELDLVSGSLVRIGRVTGNNPIIIRGLISAPATWSTLSLLSEQYVQDGTATEQADIVVTNLAIRTLAGIGNAEDIDIRLPISPHRTPRRRFLPTLVPKSPLRTMRPST